MARALRDTDLLVIGAGAKAAAIATKVHVLNSLGLGPIELTIIESTEVAASWSGANGYTSGAETLALTPAKDVGFPYESFLEFEENGLDVDTGVIPFSWQRYLISRQRYARWIDAGSPPVSHREYGRYLRWVLSQATNGVELIDARVREVSVDELAQRWMIYADSPDGAIGFHTGALVVTGPGVHRPLPHDPSAADRIFHCDSRRPELARIPLERECDIAIVGGGESALSSLLFLRGFRPDAQLTVYTPTLPLSRGESFLENRVFSNPDSVGWERLSLDDRREFVKQCDRGVFGPDGLESIAYDDQCHFINGRVLHIGLSEQAPRVTIRHQALTGELLKDHDFVVNCIGFDLLEHLRALLSPAAAGRLQRLAGPIWTDSMTIEPTFGRHLEVRGMTPRLHIPGIAAVSQGPGFANLGCLGLLANRVIQPLYTELRALRRSDGHRAVDL